MNQFTHFTLLTALKRFALAVLLTSTAPRPIEAAEQPAEVLITQGIELRREGRDADAVSKFEEAYRLSPTPRASAQLGLCLQAVGRWSDAEKYLQGAIGAKGDKWIAKNREILHESLEQLKMNLARVEVYGGPDGATVSVNGVIAGKFPLKGSVLVNAGTVDIEVTKPGFRRGYRTLQIPGTQYQKVLVRLESDPSLANFPGVSQLTATKVAASTVPPSSLQLSAQAPPQSDDFASTAPEQVSKPLYKRPWAWATAGAAILAGILVVTVSSNPAAISPKPDDRGTYQP